MLDVFFSVAVDIGCDGWLSIEESSPHVLQLYESLQWSLCLPYHLDAINDHRLKGSLMQSSNKPAWHENPAWSFNRLLAGRWLD